MTNAHNGLRLALRPPREEPAGEKVLSAIPAGLTILLGLCLTICQWFPAVEQYRWQLFLGVAAASAALWLLELTGRGRWVCAGGLVLLAGILSLIHI